MQDGAGWSGELASSGLDIRQLGDAKTKVAIIFTPEEEPHTLAVEMDIPSLTIKLKGAQALQALAGKSVPAAALGKAAVSAAPLEGARWIAASTKGGAAKSVATIKAASAVSAKTTGLAASAALPSAGTIWSGTGMSLGLGLGLGALGPVLLLGVLGLTATGIYLYRRGGIEVHEHPDDELPAPVVEPIA
jgi:hypothetical protein